MKSIEISPSILNATNVEEFLKNINILNNKKLENNIAYIHLDVMDEIFVKEKGVSLSMAKTVTSFGFLNDVHLMVSDVRKYINEVLKYKPAVITIHYEAPNFKENLVYLNNIRKQKKYGYFDIGVSIKPSTKVEVLGKYKEMFDVLLLMSVEPGLGGQEFLKETYSKIKDAKIILGDKILELDGGINDKTIKDVINSGVDRLVIGSYLTEAKDLLDLEQKLKKIKN